MAAVPSGTTPGVGGMCTDFDTNAAELNSALADAEILTNGVLTLTQIDGSTFTNNIPYFADFVISGLNLNISNVPINRSLNYTSGTYQINAQVYTIGLAGNFQLTAGHPTLPRVDIIYVNNASNIVYLTGTAAVNPVQPAVPAGGLLIAAIGVQINATVAANYTLTTVNTNGTIIAPATLNPGTAYGNTLFWNGIKWIETNEFYRTPTGFTTEAYEFLTTDATGVTTVFKVGESPTLGERGFEFQVNNLPDFEGKLIFGTENAPAPRYTQLILDTEDFAAQYKNVLEINPTINYSKIDSATDNEYTEVYQDYETVELANYNYTSNAINSKIKVMPNNITIEVIDNITGDYSSTYFTPLSNTQLVSDITGQNGSLQLNDDFFRAKVETASLTEFSEINMDSALTRIKTEDSALSDTSKIDVLTTAILLQSNSIGLQSSFSVGSNSIIAASDTHFYINSGKRIKQRNTAISTAIANNDYMIVATAAPITITLPAAPDNGRELVIISNGVATGGNPITINGNGKNINAAATSLITTAYGKNTIVYNSALNKWLITVS